MQKSKVYNFSIRSEIYNKMVAFLALLQEYINDYCCGRKYGEEAYLKSREILRNKNDFRCYGN